MSQTIYDRIEKLDTPQAVELAIYAAEQVLHIWESKYPKDDRPRKTIEAAKRLLADPSEEHGAAAFAASSDAASAASFAAHASADAADAADAAAYAARYATVRAYAAAVVAEKDFKEKIKKWLDERGK